jgi:regulatory protein
MPAQEPANRLEWLTDWVTEQRAAEADKPEPDFDPWSGSPQAAEPPAAEPPVLEPPAFEPPAFEPLATSPPSDIEPSVDDASRHLAGEPPSPPESGSPSAAVSRVLELRELVAKAETARTPVPPASRRRRPARLEEPAAPDPFGEQPEPKPARRRAASAPEDSGRDPAGKARDICLNLLTARPRTRDELRKALLRKGIEADVAEQVLGRLDDVGLIDDKAFAEMWVHSRHTYQGMGRRALAVELRRRGVDNDTAAEAVASVDSDAEEERARQLVRKRLPSMGSADQPAKIRRLVGMLARKGYAQGLAFRVVKEELQNVGEETNLLDTLE